MPTIEQKIKISKSLNEYHSNYAKLIFIDNTNCLECDKNFEFKCSYRNPRKYCSFKCIGIHSNKINSNVSYRRSKNEIYFAELCMEWYSNVVTNKKMFDILSKIVPEKTKELQEFLDSSCQVKTLFGENHLCG